MAINCQDVSARMMEAPLRGAVGRRPRRARGASRAGARAAPQSWRRSRARARPPAEPSTSTSRRPARIRRSCARPRPPSRRSRRNRSRRAPPRRSRHSGSAGACAWTLPTFATLGAVAVVVLASKVFLEPDKTVELGRRALQSAPAEAPAAPPVVVAEPPATGRQATAKEDEQAGGATGPEPKRSARTRRAAELQPSVANNAPARVDRRAGDGATAARGARRVRCARRSDEGGRCRQLRTSARLQPPTGFPSRMTWRSHHPPAETGASASSRHHLRRSPSPRAHRSRPPTR